MTLDRETLALLDEALARLQEGFDSLPDVGHAPPEAEFRAVLLEAATRMQDNFPYPHPLYVGQMLKPPHPIARLAYAFSLWVNPNNHALDGGRASSALEREAVAHLAAMFGWEQYLGHLCGGGTMANLEALWVAREVGSGDTGGRGRAGGAGSTGGASGTVVASSQAHYTHARLSGVLGVPYRSIAVDARGRMDVEALARELAVGDVSTVVATLGATATGAVDPLAEILPLARAHGARVHVDAAYGGYFRLASNLGAEAARAFDHVSEADSIVVDPHKHGLQPYGCGCVLFRDPAVGTVYRHDSPYTYFSSDDLHLGEISLECSRAGASAVALWATQRLLPCVPGGRFANDLETCRDTALLLHARLEADPRFAPLFAPDLDIVAWAVVQEKASAASAAAKRIFDAAAKRDLHLALARFPRALAEAAVPDLVWDEDAITCLRACAMKPEHGTWLDEILARLDRATTDALTRAR